MINKAARITENTSTLMDNIFMNLEGNSLRSGLFLTDISDHYQVFVTTDIPSSTEEAPGIPRYNINRYTMDIFKRNIEQINWTIVPEHTDAQLAFSNFH